MKSKISKILGVAVTIAILASLMITGTALPASAAAGALNFGLIGYPSNLGNVLVASTGGPTEGVQLLAGTPDGTTLFALEGLAATPALYKSTNSGATWTATTYTATAAPVALLVSPTFATDNTVVIAYAASVVISANGGTTFSAAPTINVEGGTITCAALGKYYANGALTVLIGMTSASGAGAGTVSNVQKFTIAAGSYAWTEFGGLTAAGVGDLSVFGIAFSTNHLSDSEIMVLADTTPGTTAGIPELLSSFAGGNFTNARALPGAWAANPTNAVIAMGTDYNGLNAGNTVLVGVNGGTLPDFYRISGRSSASAGSAASYGLAASVKSIAVNGPIASANVLVGMVATPTVERCSTITGSTYTLVPASKAPTGASGTCSVIWGGTSAFVGTTGMDSAVSVSTDGAVNFNGVGLCNVGTLASMSLVSINVADANDLFLIMGNATGGTFATRQLWVTSNGGTSWMRDAITGVGGLTTTTTISPSPNFATDKTFYVSQGGASVMIYKSVDGGNSFTAMVSSSASNIIKAVDGTNYYYGGTAAGTFYKYGVWLSAIFPTGTAGTVNSIAINPTSATTIAVGMAPVAGAGGGMVYVSTDGGATFTSFGAPGAVTESEFVAYGPDGSLYALGSGTSGVKRWLSGTSWLALQAITTAGTGLNVTTDGTLYAFDTTAPSTATTGGVWRSLYPTAGNTVSVAGCQFQALNNFNGFSGMAAAAVLADGDVAYTATGNTIFAIDTVTTATSSGYLTPGELLGFSDTLTVAPTLSTPADKSQVSTQTYAAATWTALTGATAYQVASDDTSNAFLGNNMGILSGIAVGALTNCIATTSATIGATATPLTGGNTYYWRVKAVSVDPATAKNNINSRWSTVRTFITTLPSVAVTTPQFPNMGATNVPVDTTFSWPAVVGATSYDFVLAEELGNANKFQIIDFGDNTTVNAYKLKEDLKYNTQYWWEVRPLSGTSVGAWSVGMFTTEPEPTSTTTTAAAPPVTPTVTVVNPTQPAPTVVVTVPTNTSPSTPVIPTYLLWAVIAVGAILVIAVIVLIVRTRRIS